MMVRITGLFYLPIVSKITFKLTQMNLEPDSLEVGSVLNWCSEKTIAPLYKGTIYSLKRSSNAPSFKATLNSWLKKDYTLSYIGRSRKANHISAVFLEKERLRRTEVERLLRESKEETKQ